MKNGSAGWKNNTQGSDRTSTVLNLRTYRLAPGAAPSILLLFLWALLVAASMWLLRPPRCGFSPKGVLRSSTATSADPTLIDRIREVLQPPASLRQSITTDAIVRR